MQCVALKDNQGLFSNIHHLKSNVEDYRLQADILELRKSIEQEKTVQEVRYVHSSLNIADALTKTTKTGAMLLQLVQTGQYDLPGGTYVRDSTMTSVRTWNELIRKEQSMEYEEGWDKIDHFVPLNPVQAQPHQPALSQKQWKLSPSPSPSFSWRPSLQESFFATEIFEQKNTPARSHREESRQTGRISKDPTLDEYHNTRTDQSNERKTMPTNSSKTKFKENMRANPVSS